MDNQSETKQRTRVSVLGVGMALGLVLGGIFGLIVDNLVIFAGFGMILGLAIATAIESRQARE
jgi:F0F1-type ATP synthase assembly protein I